MLDIDMIHIKPCNKFNFVVLFKLKYDNNNLRTPRQYQSGEALLYVIYNNI